MQGGQISGTCFELAHVDKGIGLPVEGSDHRGIEVLISDHNRMETGFLKSRHDTFLIVDNPVVFRTGGRQDDRDALMGIVRLGDYIREMHQAVELLHTGSRFPLVTIQAPFHSARSLTHYQHIDLTLAFGLYRFRGIEGKIG